MAINNALITELEILNIKNNIYKELLNDLEMHKKNESLICSVKKIIKNNHKIIINIEEAIENELDFSESDDLLEKVYNQTNDFSKLIKKKYYKYNLLKLQSVLSRNEKTLNLLLKNNIIDCNISDMFDTKLKILAIHSIIDKK